MRMRGARRPQVAPNRNSPKACNHSDIKQNYYEAWPEKQWQRENPSKPEGHIHGYGLPCFTPFMCFGESHRRSLLKSCSGTSLFRTSPPIRNAFLSLFLHMHRVGHSVRLKGYTCIPETVTISAVLVQYNIGWWVGKSRVTRRQPAMLWKKRLWILAHLPDLVTTFLLADVAHLQQTNLVSTECHCGQWEIFFGPSSGP